MSTKIELTKEEALEGAIMGSKRRLTNIFKELSDLGHKGLPIGGSWWSNDIEAACAEIAFSKFIGEEWVGSVNTFSAPDVGKEWQVRYTDLSYGSLIIRNKDKKNLEQKFVLVTGQTPVFHIKGYITCKNAIKDEFLKNPNNKEPAWFVPQSKLLEFN